MKMKPFIEKLLSGEGLKTEEAASALDLIMTGESSDLEVAGLLVALRGKGESVEEIVGFARTMRAHAIQIHTEDPDAIDMCGTGGDGLGTFNISTASAFVAAGAGVTVAKHGNRSVSSPSGIADLLQALGVKIDLPPARVEECVNRTGIGFLYAPLFHPAMKYAAPARKGLGIRTIFNMLGPITNPAGVQRQVIGTYGADVSVTLAGALSQLGTELACVLHSENGMDEVSLSGSTMVQEVAGARPVHAYKVTAREFGLPGLNGSSVSGGGPEENAAIVLRILEGKRSPHRDIVAANGGFGIFVAGKARSLEEGTQMAAESIDSGRAMEKLRMMREFSNR